MRVVLYAKGFPPAETGGPSEVALHIAKEFVRGRNLQLTLILQTDSAEAEIRRLLGAGRDVDVLRLPYYPAVREPTMLGPVLRAFARADVIHFNEFPFRHMPLIVLAKARGGPVVFSMHGLISGEIRTFLGPAFPLTIRGGEGAVGLRFPKAAAGALLRAYQAFAHSWTAIVVPSEALRREATSVERFPPARVAVIPHGVDGPRGTPEPPAPHAGPLRVLFVGKLEVVKGPDLLLEAIARLRAAGIPVESWIVGAGSLEARLRAVGTSLSPTRILFLGARRGEQLASLYSAADIVVVPSRRESLSLVVLEAMAAGRPILATNVGGIPELVREPRNALLVRPEVHALAEGLQRLLEHPELRASMAAANLEDARWRSWSTVADRYVRLYNGLLAGAQAEANRTSQGPRPPPEGQTTRK